MGQFNQIRWRFPSYKRKPQPDRPTIEGGSKTEYEQHLLFEYKDLTAWLDGMPSGVAGDSGALAYAMDDWAKIPLGLSPSVLLTFQ
ncbi:hypothetical protein Ptr902_03780 [Pyrenophora tritici-repentis]|nr:hypothetical protein L13192_06257 [Pyrenophora tritici-repentis]KAI2484840.1 hypothetical protein Ptr902_03780 [Pyrenophora tritici-repentis]